MILAEVLGIKEALPPYLDPTLKIEDLLTGVCFASAGSGYDPVTVKLTLALSTDDQLQMFKGYIEKLKAAVGDERTALFLAKSLFIISMGTNDISVTYFLTPFRKTKYDIERYTSMLVTMSSNFLQKNSHFVGNFTNVTEGNLSIGSIGIIGISPVGCVPMQRTIRGGRKRNCAESVNQAAMVYNSKLSSSIMALNKSFPNPRLVYLESYGELNELIQHHNHFGFEVGDSACCGILNLEFGPFCALSLKFCKDASKYVFWDSYHPTERAYSILVSEIIKRTWISSFKNTFLVN
ncbi:hypothetical protein VNO77_02205 [Canavalia gladiata]|uniref:Uncharacterized protein n=1 Tax=Canavalia gladiata TaxID=3824 RepID=A0AAN9MXH6_CANGL